MQCFDVGGVDHHGGHHDVIDQGNSGRIPVIYSSGQAYIFWFDKRDHTDWIQPGNAVYYTIIDGGQNSLNFINRNSPTPFANVAALSLLLTLMVSLFYSRVLFT